MGFSLQWGSGLAPLANTWTTKPFNITFNKAYCVIASAGNFQESATGYERVTPVGAWLSSTDNIDHFYIANTSTVSERAYYWCGIGR